MGMATYYKDTSDTFPSLNNNLCLFLLTTVLFLKNSKIFSKCDNCTVLEVVVYITAGEVLIKLNWLATLAAS